MWLGNDCVLRCFDGSGRRQLGEPRTDDCGPLQILFDEATAVVATFVCERWIGGKACERGGESLRIAGGNDTACFGGFYEAGAFTAADENKRLCRGEHGKHFGGASAFVNGNVDKRGEAAKADRVIANNFRERDGIEEGDVFEIHGFGLRDEIGASGAVANEEKVHLRMRGFEELCGVENVVDAVSEAERAGPESDLFSGETELREKRFVWRTRAKGFGVGAIGQEENFFSGDAFLFLKNFHDPVGDGVDVGGAAVAPEFDSAKSFHDEAVFEESLIDDDVRPEIGDIEDERRTPEESHEPCGRAKKKGRRFDEDVIGALAAEHPEEGSESKRRVVEHAFDAAADSRKKPDAMESEAVPEFAAVKTFFVAREEFALGIVREGSDDFDFVAAASELSGEKFETSLCAADFGGKVLREDQEAHGESMTRKIERIRKRSRPGPIVREKLRERECWREERRTLRRQTCGTRPGICAHPTAGPC